MAEISYGYSSVSKAGVRRTKPFRISLQATIQPKNFGDAKNNYKFDKDVFKRYSKSNATIKTKMHLLETAINKLTNNYLINSVIPKPEDFKRDLKIELGQIEIINEAEKPILEYLYEKIKKDEENLLYGQKKGVTEGTIKSYRTLSHHIENYQITTGDVLTFSNFDEERYWNFWNILNDIFKGNIEVVNPNQPKKQRKDINGYSANSLQKQQKNLLAVLRLANKDYDLILDVGDKNLTLKDSASMKDFYVSEQELLTIINADVSHNNKLKIAKEYAIIGALTGMRFESMEDTRNIETQQCIEDGYNFQFIHSKHFKTSTEVFIPLLKPVRNILEDHKGKFPKFPKNQLINQYLKDLFEYLEIDDEVELTKHTYSDGTIEMSVQKYEVVSTHDFKHSFYTNLYKHKVNHSVIDDITHPDRPPKNPMAKIYNRSKMLDKAKMFVDEISKIDSSIYTF